jgi:hypothetical protein
MTADEFEKWLKEFNSTLFNANCTLEHRINHIRFMLSGVDIVEDRAFLTLKYIEYLI